MGHLSRRDADARRGRASGIRIGRRGGPVVCSVGAALVGEAGSARVGVADVTGESAEATRVGSKVSARRIAEGPAAERGGESTITAVAGLQLLHRWLLLVMRLSSAWNVSTACQVANRGGKHSS